MLALQFSADHWGVNTPPHTVGIQRPKHIKHCFLNVPTEDLPVLKPEISSNKHLGWRLECLPVSPDQLGYGFLLPVQVEGKPATLKVGRQDHQLLCERAKEVQEALQRKVGSNLLILIS